MTIHGLPRCASALVPVLFLCVLCACASDSPAARGVQPGGPAATGAEPARRALTAAVFPLSAPPAEFRTSQRARVRVRLEPVEGGTRMWISGDGLAERRIDWSREGDSFYCADGPDRRVEFLRVGSRPGATWTSSGRTIRFDGWERVETPAGLYDAARVSSSLRVPPYTEVETWWFAPDVGLVQMRVDKGDLYSLEMKRVR